MHRTLNNAAHTSDDASSLSNPLPLIFTTTFASTPHLTEPLSFDTVPLLSNGAASNCIRSNGPQLKTEDNFIKVTLRTRDGTRSPYMTPTLSDTLFELDFSSGTLYGFNYSGRSSPVQMSSPNKQVTTNTFSPNTQGKPMAYPTSSVHSTSDGIEKMDDTANVSPLPAIQTQDDLPSGVVHRALHDRCRFVSFPSNLPPEPCNNSNTTANGKASIHKGTSSLPASDGCSNTLALFIGQVRFETTPAELRWLVHRVSGACVSHLESRGAGCYLLYCRSEADLHLVRRIHKRVLFDIGGVWLARTAEEIDALCEYIALEAPLFSRKAHLPRDSMVVEEFKVDATCSASSRRVLSHPALYAPPQYTSYSLPLQQQGPGISSVYTPCGTFSAGVYNPAFPSPYPPPQSQPGLPPPPYNI